MKLLLSILVASVFLVSCQQKVNKDKVKQEVIQTEKAFEKMSVDKGLQEAFYFFAADSAVIKRQNDTLVVGKENIKDYYSNPAFVNARVTWTPDFVEVSDCGDMAYTYGEYVWKIWSNEGDTAEYVGVFQTIWKKQEDGKWKYVWD